MKKVVNPVSMLVLVSVMLVGLVGCGQKEAPVTPEVPVNDNPPVVDQTVEAEVEVSMVEVVNTIKYALGEQYLPSMPLDQETFNQLTGLTSDMYEEFYAEVPMMSAHVDKLFVVRAADEVAAHNLSVKFEEFHQIQVEDAHQYPMNLAKVENAKVSVHGDYVFYYILGGYPVEEVEEVVEEAVAEDTVVEDAVVEDAVVEETVEVEGEVTEVGTEPDPNSAVEEAPVEEVPSEPSDVEMIDAEAVETVSAPVDSEVAEISEDGEAVVEDTVDPEYEKLAAWAVAANEKVEEALNTLFEIGYNDEITAEVEAMFGPTVIPGAVEEATEPVEGEDVVVEEVEGEPYVPEDAEVVEPTEGETVETPVEEEVTEPTVTEGTVSDFE